MKSVWTPSLPESQDETPLLKADDWFSVHRKGPMALYTLGERMGHEQLIDVLRSFLEKYQHGEPPLPTSMDL